LFDKAINQIFIVSNSSLTAGIAAMRLINKNSSNPVVMSKEDKRVLQDIEFKRNRLLKRALLFIVLPCVLASAYVYIHLRTSLPPQSGKFQAEGISQSVAIVRDKQGVPTVSASTNEDAFFAVGYLHAQDRLWQLEFQRRLAYGELSEIFGYKLLEQDKWMRTLGLKYAAQASWNDLSEEARQSLLSYTNGINAWLKQAKQLPPEFEMLAIEPRPWTVIDSLVWNKFFALSLAKNVRTEIDFYLAKQALSAKQLTSLFPQTQHSEQLADSVELTMAMQGLKDIQLLLEQNFSVGGKNVGSNAWIVSGKHTQNGLPVLANDPHLGIQIPSLWYAAKLKGSSLNVSGMTLVGLPLVIFGHNQHIAWGGTNLMADVQDLYYEQVNLNNTEQYLTADGWKTFSTRQETINVKAEQPASLRPKLKPVKLNIRYTETGPIVSDMFGIFEQPISLSWVGLKAQDTTYQALLEANYASDWESFQAAFSKHVAPALNILYADNLGNIGHLTAGRLPKRLIGEGLEILPAWKAQYRWQGYVDFAKMPKFYNPESGYLVQANNHVAGDVFISSDFASPARAQRIEQLIKDKIEKKEAITADFVQQMQTDIVDVSAQKLLPALLKLKPTSERQQTAMSYLQHWQGAMAIDSQAAAIFNVWLKFLRKDLIARNVNDSWGNTQQRSGLVGLSAYIEVDEVEAMLAQPEVWCLGDHAAQTTGCDKLLARTLDEALEELEKFFGADMQQWGWGKIQTELYQHNPFSDMKLVNLLFERRHSTGGSPNTINVASGRFDKTEGYLKTFGAGFRFVIDLSKQQGRLSYVNAIGQSGHFLSEHYDDMFDAFHKGKLFSIDDVEVTAERIVLNPQVSEQ